MRYEIATLSYRLGTLPKLLSGIEAHMKSASRKGEVLGCWTTDIGTLNRCLILSAFADDAAMQAERQRLQAETDPFGCGDAITRMMFESYAAFHWMPPVTPGKFGAVYEFRTYILRHGGIEPTSAAWQPAMAERGKRSPMVGFFYSLEGPLRVTHIWPYADLRQRADIRGKAVADGIWPPKGGPDWLTGEMESQIAVPASFSPLA